MMELQLTDKFIGLQSHLTGHSRSESGQVRGVLEVVVVVVMVVLLTVGSLDKVDDDSVGLSTKSSTTHSKGLSDSINSANKCCRKLE